MLIYELINSNLWNTLIHCTLTLPIGEENTLLATNSISEKKTYQCGALDSRGKLNAIRCDNQLGNYICEHELPEQLYPGAL